MMGSNSDASVAIFLALANAKSRRDVLVAACDSRLDEGDKELFSALMVIYQSLDAQRNDLAHGLFSHSDDIEDGVLWAASQDEAKHTVNLLLNIEKAFEDFKDPKEYTFFYTVKDLETLHKQMFEFWQTVFSFTVYLREGKEPGSTGEKQYYWLCNSPQIQQELARRRSGKQASPP
jgi:hypothetical protein